MAGKKDADHRSKATRAGAILKIISAEKISSQKELMEKLAQMGFKITQATLSRDMSALHLMKTSDGILSYYQAPGQSLSGQFTDTFYQLMNASLISADYAQNLVVLHTQPGMAQALCSSIDHMNWENLLGTIAGDDTILIITRDTLSASGLTSVFKKLLQSNEKGI